MREYHKPSTCRVAMAVGRVTFLEVIRDKILYNIILCAVLLFAVGYLASRLTFVRPERVVLDFGVSAVNLSCAMIAIFTGASLIGREIERRTIHVALSHPISRAQFVFGKFLGIVAVLVVNWALLCGTYLIILAFSNTADVSPIQGVVGWALGLVLIQSCVLSAVALFFSSFSTTSLSAILTIGVYLIGNSSSQIRAIAAKSMSTLSHLFFTSIALLMPDLERFNLREKVTYGLPVSNQFLFMSLLYGLVLAAFFVLLAGVLVRSKDA